MRVYVNGREAGTGKPVVTAVRPSPEPLRFGWLGSYGYFNGLVREATVYSRAMTANEVFAVSSRAMTCRLSRSPRWPGRPTPFRPVKYRNTCRTPNGDFHAPWNTPAAPGTRGRAGDRQGAAARQHAMVKCDCSATRMPKCEHCTTYGLPSSPRRAREERHCSFPHPAVPPIRGRAKDLLKGGTTMDPRPHRRLFRDTQADLPDVRFSPSWVSAPLGWPSCRPLACRQAARSRRKMNRML